MIEQVLIYFNTILAGYNLFTANYGMCELKNDGKGKVVPVFYNNGKWYPVTFNRAGISYYRKRTDVDISDVDSVASCQIIQQFQYPLMLVCVVRRDLTPTNSIFTPDQLAAQLVKDLTFTGGDLKRQIKATQLIVRTTVYSTNSEQILQEELSGLSNVDFSRYDLAIALQINVTINTKIECIDDVCDSVPRFCLQLESYVALL